MTVRRGYRRPESRLQDRQVQQQQRQQPTLCQLGGDTLKWLS